MAAAVVLLLYAVLGFLAIPRLVQWQLPRMADSQLRREASVGDVRFNPFTLRLVADKLALKDLDGRPMASIEHLEAQGDWLSPFRRAWSLRELHVDAPDLQVRVDPDGGSNLSRLIESWQAHQDKGAVANDHATPRFITENVEVTRGRVSIDDRRAGFTDQITPINLRLNRLSTLPQDVDGYELSADITSGGRLRWRGEASLNPIRAKGEITLEALDLRAADPYLRRSLRLAIREGQLNAKLPYSIEVNDKTLQAQLLDAGLTIQGLRAALPDAKEPFAVLEKVEVTALSCDLAERTLSVGAIRASSGQLQVRRDVQGQFDLTRLSPQADSADGEQQKTQAPWKLAARQVQLERIALRAVDGAAQPPATWQADAFGLSLQADGQAGPKGAEATLRNLQLTAQGLSVTQGGAQLVRLDHLELADGAANLREHHLEVGRLSVNGGQVHLVRDERGDIDLMRLAPASSPKQDDHAPNWKAHAHHIALAGLTVDVEDRATGSRTQLQDVKLRAEEAGTDLSRPVRIDAGLRFREGGELALQGQASPEARSFLGDVQLHGLSVLMAQPVLQRYLRVKLASGTVDAQGRLEGAVPADKTPTMRFQGSAAVAGFRLNEVDGTPLAFWRTLSASRITADLQGVTIPELKLVASYFPLTIQANKTLNTSRLLVPRPPGPAPAPAHETASPAGRPAAPFAVRIGAFRLQGGRLKFTDLSLQPPFGAEIHDLNGTITALRTRPDSHSQVQLDGTVDQYGEARIRGGLNLLALAQDTDVRVIFRNIDMVKQSPYAMRFAGYRIASGKMSLDLHYQVHDNQLLGDNRIVIDQLTLGERVESPEATKLPVALAISILKDDQGRIDLGLPVSGNLADPDFSYTALFLKALGSLVTKVVTAPFRNFAGGANAQQFDAIDFDAGSAQLHPPEREKLAHVADVLNKRAEFKLAVPASYAQDADAAALRAQAVRQELARRGGVTLSAQEAQGPPNLNDRNVRSALRDLYVQRFGQPELDKARQAAQTAASGAGKAPQLSLFQQLGRSFEGEPQVEDTSGFYRNLLRRLEQEQPLPADALARLGQDRAQAVATAVTGAGVAPARVTLSAPEAVAANDQRMVPLKLALDLH